MTKLWYTPFSSLLCSFPVLAQMSTKSDTFTITELESKPKCQNILKGVCDIFKLSNLSYLTFFNMLLFLASFELDD
jgi:hypothetical protein